MVQEDYHSQNPYHNAVHAADVTQAMHCYLKEPKVRQAHWPPSHLEMPGKLPAGPQIARHNSNWVMSHL